MDTPHFPSNQCSKTSKAASGNEEARISRLLRMVQEIRNEPRRSLQSILQYFDISRSQFYKDKKALADVGFRFEYRKTTGFHILEDKLSPLTDLSLSDRLILMFALEHLSVSGEGHLAAQAMEVGRKLAGGLEAPFREQLLHCFDHEITENVYGVRPEIFALLRTAITEGRRIRMLYERSGDWSIRRREVEPRRIYLRQRTLYLYARTVDETPPQWKVFRLGRIKEIQFTEICATYNPEEDDGFQARQRNAFMAFIGTETRTVKIRFSGDAKHFVSERRWHVSQKIEEDQQGHIIFTVNVAEPQEVLRWARQFGDEAEVLEVETETKSETDT